MLCLHGKWFCNQYSKCQFVCSEEDGYLYERAIHAFLAVNHVLPQCCVLEDPNNAQNPNKPQECNFAKFYVVKDPEKESYGRSFFKCSKKDDRCEYFEWGDEVIKEKPLCKHGKQCRVWKVKKKVRIKGEALLGVQLTLPTLDKESNNPFTAYVSEFNVDYKCKTQKTYKKI